jgi:8-oxo-dGTP diphosphatase
LEFGETPEEALKRETLEETGLEIISTEFICVSNVISYGKHYIDLEFKAEVKDGEPKLLEPEKFTEWKWFDIDDPPKPLFKAIEYALNSYKTNKKYNSGINE